MELLKVHFVLDTRGHWPSAVSLPSALHVLEASGRPGHSYVQTRTHPQGARSRQQFQSIHATTHGEQD